MERGGEGSLIHVRKAAKTSRRVNKVGESKSATPGERHDAGRKAADDTIEAKSPLRRLGIRHTRNGAYGDCDY
jgi:hypothetical protein